MDFLPPSAFCPNYLSLEEIAATQVKVPCQTNVILPKFGFLEPSFGKKDLPADVAIDLPLWAATALAKRGFVTVTVPKSYKPSHREILRADPTVVDLNKLGPQFYQSGLHIAALPLNDSEDLGEILPEVLKKRLLSMADLYGYMKAFRTTDIDGRTGTLMKESHMDALEHRLFDTAKKGAEELSAWMEN